MGFGEMVRLLLEHGAPPGLRYRYEVAPLTSAADYATLEAVDLLLDASASWDQLSSSALQDRNAEILNAPLCGPAMRGNGSRVIELPRRGTAPVANNMEDSGRAASHGAADNGDLAMAEALIVVGADVNLHYETTSGQSPLDAAVFGGQAEMTVYLISQGTDPDRPTWVWRSIRERMLDGDPDIDPLVRERFAKPSLKRRRPGRIETSDEGKA